MSLPLIDLDPALDAEAPGAHRIAAALHDALHTVGFACLRQHGVPAETTAAAFAASREFHASRLEDKQGIAINAFHRGYMGLATSTVRTSSVAQVTRPNLSESLMLMHELPVDDPARLAGEPLQGPNQWPDWLPGFRAPIERYRDAVEAVCRYLVRLLATGLGLPPRALDVHFERPTTFLRLLHYPPQPPETPGQYGSAPHTDYGFITLLAQDTTGGLQVRPRAGDWIDAPPIEGSFVLNVGDMLARWTNERFVSTPHRVVNRSGVDRYSLPYFFDPGMDRTIECLPTCTDAANPPRHRAVRYGHYLMERLDKNYDYRRGANPAPAGG